MPCSSVALLFSVLLYYHNLKGSFLLSRFSYVVGAYRSQYLLCIGTLEGKYCTFRLVNCDMHCTATKSYKTLLLAQIDGSLHSQGQVSVVASRPHPSSACAV